MTPFRSTPCLVAIYLGVSLLASTANAEGEPFRPDVQKKDANHNRGAGIFLAENHVLLEDAPSHCQREGKA